MRLVVEETPMGPGTKMGMIGTRETPDTTRMLQTIDQPEALMTGGILQGSDKNSLVKINDLSSVVLGGSPGTVEFSVGSEVKIELEQPRIYATCSKIAEKGTVTSFMLRYSDQRLSQQ